jgi:hypothetical protein
MLTSTRALAVSVLRATLMAVWVAPSVSTLALAVLGPRVKPAARVAA